MTDEFQMCAHGIPLAERKARGCAGCDEVYLTDKARRERVIGTARSVLPQLVVAWINAAGEKAIEYAGRDALRFAEAFETAADEYRKAGKP